MRRTLAIALVACTIAAAGVSALGAAPAIADGPGAGTPWVVSLGDSYISGVAGRWAGNSNSSSSSVDAGGSGAYLDNGGASETISGCHRSTAAEIHIGRAANGSTVNSLNLACSGARTSTSTYADGSFKPGIDFYNSDGLQGQALTLQQFAAGNNVRMVVLSIGGNNFGFASIVERCVTNFLTSSSLFPNYCYDDASVVVNFTRAHITAQTTAIRGAIENIKTAMLNAGYTTSQYTIVVQTYPSPVPNGSRFRYSQSGFSRQFTGGCGFWNRDADWANTTALGHINGAVRSAAAAANTSGNVRTLDPAPPLVAVVRHRAIARRAQHHDGAQVGVVLDRRLQTTRKIEIRRGCIEQQLPRFPVWEPALEVRPRRPVALHIGTVEEVRLLSRSEADSRMLIEHRGQRGGTALLCSHDHCVDPQHP